MSLHARYEEIERRDPSGVVHSAIVSVGNSTHVRGSVFGMFAGKHSRIVDDTVFDTLRLSIALRNIRRREHISHT